MRKNFKVLIKPPITPKHSLRGIAIANMKRGSLHFQVTLLLFVLTANGLEDATYETEKITSDKGKK